MAKNIKVLDLLWNGKHYFCIENTQNKTNPFTLYEKWYDQGWHRRKIISYADIDSVLFHLIQMKHKRVAWDLTA